MLVLIELKYNDVQAFKIACHESGQSLLLETTTDIFWGVGYRCHEANHKDILAFTGHNLLGWIVMLVLDKHMGRYYLDKGISMTTNQMYPFSRELMLQVLPSSSLGDGSSTGPMALWIDKSEMAAVVL